MKKIGEYGMSNYYINNKGRVLCGVSEEDAEVIYSETPIHKGYREFMNASLYKAMAKEGLFHD